MERKDPRGMKLKDYFISNFNGKFLLNHSVEPYVVGHLVLQPIEHITHLHEPFSQLVGKQCMDENEANRMIEIIRKVFTLLEECLIKQTTHQRRSTYACLMKIQIGIYTFI
jgi:hypothetical protein